MSREIKFRTYLEGIGFKYFTIGEDRIISTKNGVNQFTGMLDKHGVEVFEGDIVYNKSSMRNHIVEYQNCYFSPFGHYELHGLNDAQYEEDGKIRFEVIGNIHENPELLDAK